MSTASYAKWKLEEIRVNREKASPNYDTVISIDFSRSRYDTERLTGFPVFLEAIHRLYPDVPDWSWSDEQVQRACDEVGMNRRSIIRKDDPRERIVIQINNKWRQHIV